MRIYRLFSVVDHAKCPFYRFILIPIVAIMFMSFLYSCGNRSPDERERALREEAERTVEMAKRENESIRKELAESQEKILQAQKQTALAQQTASEAIQEKALIKGVGVAMATFTLIVGAALGSKARKDAKKRKKGVNTIANRQRNNT